uniref:SANT domain-containing protein n=1 Tax=Meloidogyne hapla TaxID=6305 RepID=A0A1I8B4J9_MELHA
MPTRNLKNEIIVKEEIKEVVEEEEMRIDEDGKLKKGGEGREHQNGDLHSNNGMDGILLEGNTKITSSQTVTNGDVRPPRKNGILFSADGPSNSEFSFAAELEQLRKQSSSSHRSHKASIFGNSGRMSIRHGGKLSLGAFTSPNDDFIRKMSSVSMEEQQSSENGDGVEKPPESDAIPHINLGKNFQARVKKWADRAISSEEREAIPDRDERLFNSSSIEHISQQALAAYETLACSVALPKSGRNKELALHILAENRGNLQAAVMDLLRCDTLDWEQYPAIYNSRYVDVDNWSPEEIASFQDAIYKSEKDFQQVSSELGNRSIYECISFYYTWKKACPDDYRKLRNLRRKRQLLEQQLDLASFDIRQQKHPMKRMRCGIDGLITNLGEDENELLKLNGKHQQITSNEEDEELSETESDITNPSLLNVNIQGMECSSSPNRKISSGHPIAPIPISVSSSEGGGGISSLDQLSVLLGNHQQQNTPSKHFNFGSNNSLNNSNYPWLHGTDGIFPSPSSSTTSNNNETHFGGLETIIPTDYDGNSGRNNNHFGTNKIKGQHGATVKKGAQPQADGFFHCRLCEKRFEKVKSLNAHMKSHAMKARAEAEALQKTQQQHQQPLAFPVPTKKEIVSSSSLSLQNNQETNQAVAAAAAAAASNPLAGALVASSVALGMPPGLSGNAQVAAMAALNSLGRQMQQQQPFTCTNSGFGLLRNMLQYGQQQVAAAAVAANDAAQTNASAAAAAARWPGL